MPRSRVQAWMLGIATLSAVGCVRIDPSPTIVRAPPPMATLSRLALVVPIPTDAGRYVATPWHKARLTIGRHDGTMPEITHTYVGGRDGLVPVGSLPPLPPGDGYFIRVELVQTMPDGTERVVGRGSLGNGDDAGIDLVVGGNLARLDIRPTVTGAQLALMPVRPPTRERTYDYDYTPAIPARGIYADDVPTPTEWYGADGEDDVPVIDYDDRKRERHWLVDDAPVEADDAAEWAPAEADDDADEDDAPESADSDDDAGSFTTEPVMSDMIDVTSAFRVRNP